jgi:hypothetical protein
MRSSFCEEHHLFARTEAEGFALQAKIRQYIKWIEAIKLYSEKSTASWEDSAIF